MLFLCESLRDSQGQDKKRAESKKKREKCLKIGLNPGSTHPPGSQLSYPPWWAPDYLVTATHPQAMLTKLTSGLH